MRARLARRLVCCDIGSRTLEELLRNGKNAGKNPITNTRSKPNNEKAEEISS
jgi:hypothetical protein